MIDIQNEKDCCGCGACAASCPVGAITLTAKGSLMATIPSVDAEKCINCGLCERVCPKLDTAIEQNDEFKQIALAAFSKNKELKFASSSGGMFLTFARKCISNGYLVYGAAFDKDLKLKCTCARTEEELLALAKSKYLQSDMSDKFAEIKQSLDKGEKVLFVSTPCQVASLKRYLRKEYSHLLTVDFFCHGVPSQELFDECIAFEDEKYGRSTLSYGFREKVKNGVTPHYFKIQYVSKGKEKTKVDFYYKSLFYALFQQYITLRESCYDCTFATRKRYSDITIGDFHDIDNYIEGINRFDGVSTVIVNTSIGQELFDSVKDELNVYSVDIDRLIGDGVIFCGGTKRPPNRDEFVKDYNSFGLSYINKKYFGTKKYLKQAIYYRMPKFARGILKKML